MKRLLALAASVVIASTIAQAEPVVADGSSTVYPITLEASKRIKRSAGIDADVKFSGTTAGFRRFCAGETDIANASRPINREELAACEASGVTFIELPIAFDALAVVVNGRNDWAKTITLAELRKIWEPAAEGKVMRWSQVREGWPDRPIKLFGRGQDSGTFDYFTAVVNGETRKSRLDYTASENEEFLAAGVAADQDALAFFGIGAYFRNWEDLQDVAIDSGQGPVSPSLDAVREGNYRPLARPLFLYVNAEKSAARPELRSFVTAYLKDLRQWVHFTGYMPLSRASYARALDRFEARTTGTLFGGEIRSGVSESDLLN